jgi:stage IV sporulation protein FB
MISIPGRIPIRMHPSFFLVSAVIGWLQTMNILHALVWVGVIFVSVLIHELGHALTALYFGQKADITFVAMGGLTQRRGPKLSLPKEFLVVLNGPLFGFSFALVIMRIQELIGGIDGILAVAFSIAIFVNIFWTLLNLVPVGPLDGAVLLNITLEGAFGVRGFKFGHLFGLSLGLVLGGMAMTYGLQILAMLLFFLSFDSFRSFMSVRSMSGEDRSGELQELFRKAEELNSKEQRGEANLLYQQLRLQAGSGLLYVAATERLAESKSSEGEYEDAFELLSPLRTRLSNGALRLLHRIAFYMRNTKEVIEIGDRCFNNDQSFETAFINALAHALLGQTKQSVGWLRAAQNKGMPQIQENLQKKEFDEIRSNKVFQEFLTSIGD